MKKRILTKYRKKELEYMCLQYNDYKSQLASINMRLGTGEWDDPTYEEVCFRENLTKKIQIIDEALSEVCSSAISPYIFKSVTKGVAYEYLGAPIGRRQFYDLKDEFYIVLSQKEQRL